MMDETNLVWMKETCLDWVSWGFWIEKSELNFFEEKVLFYYLDGSYLLMLLIGLCYWVNLFIPFFVFLDL